MAVESSIVEQLQELRRWQLQQQEELIRQQKEQREKLTDEQNRMYHALSLSVDEMNLSNQSLIEIIKEHKEEETEKNLIDFDAPEESVSPMPQRSHSFSKYLGLSKENNNNKSLMNLKVPTVQLSVKSTKTDSQPNVEYNDSYNQLNYSSDLLTDDTQSFSFEKRKNPRLPIDEIPIPSPKKDFNTLLEERLKESSDVSIENKSKPVVKKPFLKKGQGLTRFMPNSNSERSSRSSIRPRSASFTTGTQSSIAKSKATLERCNSMPKSRKNDMIKKCLSNPTPFAQSKLVNKNIPSSHKKGRSKSIGAMPNSVATEKNKILKPSDLNSSDLETKSKRELEEVRIFELLEDKAENSSFCSTSSTVIAFLQQSTPLKQKALLHSASKHKISFNDIGDQTLEDIIQASKSNNLPLPQLQKYIKEPKVLQKSSTTKLKGTKTDLNLITHPTLRQKHSKVNSQWDNVPISKIKNDKTIYGTVLPYGTDLDLDYEDYTTIQELSHDEHDASLHVRFSEHNEYKTMTDTSSISSDSQIHNDKGVWSDGSITPDSSDIESISKQLINNVCTDNKKNIDTFKLLKTADETDEDEVEDFKGEQHEEDHEHENEDNDEDEYESKNVTLEKDDTVIDDLKNESASLFKSELLKTRLLELEQEIEIFRKESAALTLQRQKLQEERTKLQEERISIQRNLKEKEELLEMVKKKTESILQEEKKRLAREKTALESRMKDAYEKAQKSKQERQEIQTLRDQLEELQEELKQKESKWSAMNARQRSQMRVLQTENSKLKQELQKIQQKKTAKVKRPVTSTNTKAIHQINKFLADRKKKSPFKNDDEFCNEVNVKLPESITTNCDVELDEKIPESKVESKVEKVKIMKTAESIARTRQLYENLLKDATEDISSYESIKRRNFINQYVENSEESTEDQARDEENDFEAENPEINNSFVIDKSSKEEYEHCNDEKNEIDVQKANNNKQGIREVHHPDGRVEYWYPNGNVKKVFPEKNLTKMIYYNGDVRETDKNGTIKYFYAATRTWHTTMPDGLEILEFPDGQVERRSKDGSIEVSFPDGSVRIVQADGSEKWALRDGTIAETSADGEKILTLPNGQREIHTKDHKRREYPDGTVKLVYPDGIQETRYANGRIRLKDIDGNLIMDTHQ